MFVLDLTWLGELIAALEIPEMLRALFVPLIVPPLPGPFPPCLTCPL